MSQQTGYISVNDILHDYETTEFNFEMEKWYDYNGKVPRYNIIDGKAVPTKYGFVIYEKLSTAMKNSKNDRFFMVEYDGFIKNILKPGTYNTIGKDLVSTRMKLTREIHYKFIGDLFPENIRYINDCLLVYFTGKQYEISVLEKLKDKGADFTIHKNFPLKRACKYGDLNTVKFLIKQGADIHADKDRPIVFATQHGHLKVIKYLVENGADLNINGSPLYWACCKNRLDIVKYLVENGAKINKDRGSALKEASSKGFFEIVKYLLEKGGDPDIDGGRPARFARKAGFLEMAKYIEKY
jgi:hypothetical protein